MANTVPSESFEQDWEETCDRMMHKEIATIQRQLNEQIPSIFDSYDQHVQRVLRNSKLSPDEVASLVSDRLANLMCEARAVAAEMILEQKALRDHRVASLYKLDTRQSPQTDLIQAESRRTTRKS